MPRGQSSSSSAEHHRRRGHRDRRTSRRSRTPRRKSTGLPVESAPSGSSTFESRYSIPKPWQPDEIYLDRNHEYKLTFPRRVIATAWTLRLVANRRLVQFEGFRNRQEAYLCLVFLVSQDLQEHGCGHRPYHWSYPSSCPEGRLG